MLILKIYVYKLIIYLKKKLYIYLIVQDKKNSWLRMWLHPDWESHGFLLGLGRHCHIGDKQPLFVFRFFSVTNILDFSLWIFCSSPGLFIRVLLIMGHASTSCVYIYIYMLVTSHRKMLPFPLFYVAGNCFLSNIWCVGLVIFCFNKGGFGFSTTSTWQ